MRHSILILILTALVFSPCLFSKIQVGEKVKQTFETPHPYPGEKGVVWQKEFHHPDAGFIAIPFTSLNSSWPKVTTWKFPAPTEDSNIPIKKKAKRSSGLIITRNL